MRAWILLGLALVLILPAGAQAGNADADATYLESTSSCTSHAHSDQEGNATQVEPEPEEPDPNGSEPAAEGSSYDRWSYHESCRDKTTYAGASVSDDQGEIASVQADGGSWEEESHSYERWHAWSHDEESDTSWSSQEERESHTHDSGWDRSVEASTTAGQAEATRECSQSSQDEVYREEERYRQGDQWSYHAGEHQSSSYEDTCEDTVAAEHDGRAVSVGRTDGCQYQEESSRSTSAWGDGGSGFATSHEREERETTCRNGAQADGPAGPVFAGGGSDCTEREDEVEHHSWSGNNSSSEGYADSSEHCFDGVLVEGPSDLTVRAGTQYDRWESCETDGGNWTCEGHQDRRFGAGVAWEDNPAGPTDTGIWAPGPDAPPEP